MYDRGVVRERSGEGYAEGFKEGAGRPLTSYTPTPQHIRDMYQYVQLCAYEFSSFAEYQNIGTCLAWILLYLPHARGCVVESAVGPVPSEFTRAMRLSSLFRFLSVRERFCLAYSLFCRVLSGCSWTPDSASPLWITKTTPPCT